MQLKRYLRDRRGVTSIEAALGTAAMIAASLLALDLYQLASAQTTTMHAAVTLADTVSRDEQLEAGFVQTLATFLHQEQFPTSNVVFVVAAVYKSPDNPTAPPTVLWTETVELGPEDGQPPTLTSCSEERELSIDTLNNPATLPDVFTMSLEELAIVAEVCVERTNTAMPGAVHAHYIVPARADNLAENLSTTS